MKEGQPSATAQLVAMARAIHQLLDHPKVFDDPMALRIIGKAYTSSLQADPRQYETSKLSAYLRAFTVARSRCAEDELALGVQRGIRQYVVLGAGLDTFAYRNPYPKGEIHVFEVDHPTTQTWKRGRLEEIGIIPPTDLTFAPIDFRTQTVQEGLRSAGFDPRKGTLFSWLGATEYVPTEAVMETLRFIVSAPVGSGVVFDYMISPSLLTGAQRTRFDFLAQYVASTGEPWQTFFGPESLVKDLRAMGFRYIEDYGQEEINARYFRDRTDGLQVGTLSHIMIARV